MIELKCQKCGKIVTRLTFYNWAYRDDRGIYCTYTCYNHRNDERRKRKYKAVTMRSDDGSILKVFDSANSAAEYTGYDIKEIQRACRATKMLNGFHWKYED